MKCIVFSDSHGTLSVMRRAIKMNMDAEVVFFLGDGLSDLEAIATEFPDKFFVAVRGNCDYYATFRSQTVPITDSITIDGFKILLTHGHAYDVKYSLDRLGYLALSEGADIVLFGHTHHPFEQYVSDCDHPYYLFNPGSASYSSGSFGLISFANQPLLSHGKIDG